MASIPLHPTGEVIARDIAYADFLTRFDGQSVEWVNGEVIQMSPVSVKHDALSGFIYILFRVFLEKTAIGRVFTDPMVMKPGEEFPARAPEIQVVLSDNYHIIKKNEIAGAADLVVEIVSPASHRRDRVEKFAEYERAGVKEYWILDPVREETLFYGRGDDGLYVPIDLNDGEFHSRVLNKLVIDPDIFWRESLPEVVEIIQMVEAMLIETAG